MHNVDIRVYKIGCTKACPDAIDAWLSNLGVEPETIDEYFNQGLSDAELVVGLAAKRCYMSFEVGLNPNITKIRKDWVAFLDNILRAGHGSVLEHATATFAIEGVSRVFTGEMNRHRAGMAISEGSMRYISFDDIPFWMPLSLDNDGKLEHITQTVFKRVFKYIEDEYRYLYYSVWDVPNMKDFKRKKEITSLLRRIIPMGVATGGVWTGNLRALRHIMALRTDEAAEEEICIVFTTIGKMLIEDYPHLFKDFVQVNGAWIPEYVKI